MSGTGNETLDRIQQEIKENLEREEELRKKYNQLNNNVEISDQEPSLTNGHSASPPPTPTLSNTNNAPVSKRVNGTTRLFAPHPSRGVMQKFIKMRGKINGVKNFNTPPNHPVVLSMNPTVEPPKVTLEPGKDIRNGFVSAEEKMRRELLEFQKREAELRKERRQSQPDLMAALEAESENETNLKQARFSSSDLSNDDSGPTSLRPAQSLSDLLLDEVDSPGTHSLIKQFESMRNQS